MKCQSRVPNFKCKVKVAKIEGSNTVLSCQAILKQFFLFPEHCVFCLCEVLSRCHRYTII